jgi:hypothetical protein
MKIARAARERDKGMEEKLANLECKCGLMPADINEPKCSLFHYYHSFFAAAYSRFSFVLSLIPLLSAFLLKFIIFIGNFMNYHTR